MDRIEHHGIGTELIGAPKSVRIAHALEREIRSGTLRRGDALASEGAMVKRFSVSRNTVRKGLEILSGKGLITTTKGIGSFVTFGGRTLDDRAGWSVALAAGEVRMSTRMLRLTRGAMELPDSPLANGTDCLIVDRLRSRDDTDQVVSLERSRMPWRAELEGIPEHGLLNGSLHATLQERGLTVQSGEEWANVLVALPAQDAELMGRRHLEPMLRLRRLTRDADLRVMEYVESILDPDLFGMHIEF